MEIIKAKNLLINILTCWICGSLFACSESNSDARVELKQETKEAVILAPKERFDMSLVEEGDIIMKNGFGRISQFIVKVLKEDISISHCGIVVVENNQAFVIQSMLNENIDSSGIEKRPLSRFLFELKRDTIYLLRHKGDAAKRKEIAAHARRLYEKGIPFDKEFNINDSSALYCSELVHLIFHEVYDTSYFKTKEIEGNHLLLFNSLLDTTIFDQIPFRLKYNPQ